MAHMLKDKKQRNSGGSGWEYKCPVNDTFIEGLRTNREILFPLKFKGVKLRMRDLFFISVVKVKSKKLMQHVYNIYQRI